MQRQPCCCGWEQLQSSSFVSHQLSHLATVKMRFPLSLPFNPYFSLRAFKLDLVIHGLQLSCHGLHLSVNVRSSKEDVV